MNMCFIICNIILTLARLWSVTIPWLVVQAKSICAMVVGINFNYKQHWNQMLGHCFRCDWDFSQFDAPEALWWRCPMTCFFKHLLDFLFLISFVSQQFVDYFKMSYGRSSPELCYRLQLICNLPIVRWCFSGIKAGWSGWATTPTISDGTVSRHYDCFSLHEHKSKRHSRKTTW